MPPIRLTHDPFLKARHDFSESWHGSSQLSLILLKRCAIKTRTKSQIRVFPGFPGRSRNSLVHPDSILQPVVDPPEESFFTLVYQGVWLCIAGYLGATVYHPPVFEIRGLNVLGTRPPLPAMQVRFTMSRGWMVPIHPHGSVGKKHLFLVEAIFGDDTFFLVKL